MSSRLLQQELLEVPPSRRVIVPRGHGAWWGVDPSTFSMSVSGVRARGGDPGASLDRWVHSHPFRAHKGSNASMMRLSDVYDGARLFTLMLCDADFPYPGVVWVERPGGKSRNYSLDYAVGAIVAGMGSALEQATGRAVRFEEIEPASWKLKACGAGNLYKPAVKKGRTAEYPVLLWAQRNGYAGHSYDEADALGIAEAARRTVALDPR